MRLSAHCSLPYPEHILAGLVDISVWAGVAKTRRTWESQKLTLERRSRLIKKQVPLMRFALGSALLPVTTHAHLSAMLQRSLEFFATFYRHAFWTFQRLKLWSKQISFLYKGPTFIQDSMYSVQSRASQPILLSCVGWGSSKLILARGLL